MNSNIDKGRILLTKKYPLINNLKNIDDYDKKLEQKIFLNFNNFHKLNKNLKKKING